MNIYNPVTLASISRGLIVLQGDYVSFTYGDGIKANSVAEYSEGNGVNVPSDFIAGNFSSNANGSIVLLGNDIKMPSLPSTDGAAGLLYQAAVTNIVTVST